ncbi:MAG: cytidylate kinase [Candidatus Altiarchaeales archaeon]|nr:MAG: cytidylate kinase [Candidatus Altiarchaeales archaeon]
MIITVSGLIGSGKSTLAREISKKYGLRYISAGEIMRQMASQRRMSLLEFSKYAEKNPEIDKEIDKKQVALAKKGKCVVDSRLAAYFIPNPSLKIWLKAPFEIRVKRIAKRDSISIEKAKKEVLERERSEKERYRRFYNIDLEDLNFYDLIIDTGKFAKDETQKIAFSAIDSLLE